MAAAGIPFAQTQTNDNDNEEAEVHRWKVVVFTDKTSDGVRAGIRIPIMIKERFRENQLGGYIWPSSLVLGRYLVDLARNYSNSIINYDWFHQKTVIELGSGCGLLSVLLDKLGARVVSTEKTEDVSLFTQLVCTKQLNNSNFAIEGLTWGAIHSDMLQWISRLTNVRYIIASDTFYDVKAFENVLATCSLLLSFHNQATIICSYHVRNGNHTIQPLLRNYGLIATELRRPCLGTHSKTLDSQPGAFEYLRCLDGISFAYETNEEVTLIEISPMSQNPTS